MTLARRRAQLETLLTPWKLRYALRRRWMLLRVARRVPLVALELERIGSEYGGWWLPREPLDPGAFCLLVGAGRDVSFDQALADRGYAVHVVDPTGESRRLMEDLADPRLTFHNVALWREDGPLRMARARDPRHKSLSAADLQGTDSWVEVPAQTVATLLVEAGRTDLALLKLDVEGAEYEILDGLFGQDPFGARPQVLCVELHPTAPARRVLRTLEALGRDGYALVSRTGAELTFVREA